MCAIDPWSQGLGGSGLALRDFQEGMGIRNMGRFVEGVGNLVRRDAIDGILRWWFGEGMENEGENMTRMNLK